MTADNGYLYHLAKLGAAHIHPLGAAATRCLLDALELRTGNRVLEIGCGTGATLVEIARTHAVRIVGVDASVHMLAVAGRRLRLLSGGSNVSLAAGRGAGLPFADETFDRVFTESVLGFQPAVEARQMLREIMRVLKPGGLYAANEAIWRPQTTAEQAGDIYEACVADFGICQASPQPWAVDEWRAVILETGFILHYARDLDDLVQNAPERVQPADNWPTRLFSLRNRARGRLDPELRRERRKYRALLSKHYYDGQYMESRLFLMSKGAQ